MHITEVKLKFWLENKYKQHLIQSFIMHLKELYLSFVFYIMQSRQVD